MDGILRNLHSGVLKNWLGDAPLGMNGMLRFTTGRKAAGALFVQESKLGLASMTWQQPIPLSRPKLTAGIQQSTSQVQEKNLDGCVRTVMNGWRLAIAALSKEPDAQSVAIKRLFRESMTS
jgi:hypothetical protein